VKRDHHIARLLAASACAAALAISGCGSDEEGKQLPASASEALRTQLQSIQNRIDADSVGACRDITEGDSTNTDAVNRILDSLPDDVDPDVRDATRDSFDRLFELVQDECTELEEQTDTETTPDTDTETTPPQTETETTPPDTETETTPLETVPIEPPGQMKKDNGDGNGGGQLAPEGD
jgi:hypothetical protein